MRRELTAQLADSPALRTLYLKGVALGADGVRALGGVLKDAKKLKSIDIRGNEAPPLHEHAHTTPLCNHPSTHERIHVLRCNMTTCRTSM